MVRSMALFDNMTFEGKTMDANDARLPTGRESDNRPCRFKLTFDSSPIWGPYSHQMFELELNAGLWSARFTGDHVSPREGSVQAVPASESAPSQDVGMTNVEKAVLVQLNNAWSFWQQLGDKHPEDDHEFATSVHALQCLVAFRVARRANPEWWHPGSAAPEPPEPDSDPIVGAIVKPGEDCHGD